MSAILEALKKLEQEVSEPSGHPLRRDIKRHRKWHKTSLAGLMAVGVILCGLAGYGVVVLTRKTPVAPVSMIDRKAAERSPTVPVSPAPATSPTNHLAKASKPYQVTASHKTLSFQEEAPPVAPAKEIVAVVLEQEQLPEEASEEAIFAYGSKRWNGTSEESPEETPENAMLPRSSLQDETEALPEAETSLTDRPKSDRVSNVVPGIFNDPAVVLQAISWSSDEARRMAVINGKICRKSEQINGYVIQQINQEDVVVSKGSVTGRLVFKIR